jgi:hypothetical protein
MRRRALLNFGLLLALALLVLLAVYEPGRVAAPEPGPLTELAAADITRIDLERSGKPPLRLYREETHWYLAGEPPLRADAAQVRNLLRLVRERVQRQYPAAELDLPRIGLGETATRLRLDDRIELRFGTTDPLDHHRYVQRDDRVYLVLDHYQYLVEAPREQWISRRLLPGDAAIVSLALPDLSLRRDADGHWLLEPEQPDIDSDAITTLVEQWRLAEALRVAPGGAREPGIRVLVGLEGQDRAVEFQVRQVGDDWRFLRTDLGLEYRVSDHTALQLLQLQATAHEPATQ